VPVGPRPSGFASTIDAEGRPNLSPFSFFNVFGANPPLMIFSPARRGRDNTTKHSYHNVKAVPEVVINVVTYCHGATDLAWPAPNIRRGQRVRESGVHPDRFGESKTHSG
jgi:flavin reductase (DIM6/NTAB) family NADH-FMN oxidoreductase RutF